MAVLLSGRFASSYASFSYLCHQISRNQIFGKLHENVIHFPREIGLPEIVFMKRFRNVISAFNKDLLKKDVSFLIRHFVTTVRAECRVVWGFLCSFPCY